MDAEAIRWCAFQDTDPPSPLHKRMAGMDSDGEVYLPLCLAINAFMRQPNQDGILTGTSTTVWAGVDIVVNDQHPFVSATWFAAKFPKHAPAIEESRQIIRQHFGYTRKESPQ